MLILNFTKLLNNHLINHKNSRFFSVTEDDINKKDKSKDNIDSFNEGDIPSEVQSPENNSKNTLEHTGTTNEKQKIQPTIPEIPELPNVDRSEGASDSKNSADGNKFENNDGAIIPVPTPLQDDSEGSALGGDTKVIDGFLGDELINTDAMSMLSIYTETDDLSSEAENLFSSYIKVKNVHIVPDDDLTHFKDRANALQLVKLGANNIFINQKNWEFLTNAYIDSITSTIAKIEPVSDSYLKGLNTALNHSNTVRAMPFWSLAPTTEFSTSKIVYGVSHGAHEIMHFMEPSFTKLNFYYEFNSLIGTKKSPNSTHATVEMFDTRDDSHVYDRKFEVLDKLYDSDQCEANFGIINTNSMYSSDSYRKIINEMFIIVNDHDENTFSASQSSTSNRTGIVTKGPDNVTYDDAFQINLVVNNDFSIAIEDKSIVDMLISLMHMEKLKLSEDGMATVVNYITTTLHRYVTSQMYISSGVTIRKLKIKVSITCKKDSIVQEDLDEMFEKFLSKGMLVPISTLQYTYALSALKLISKDFSEWEPFSILVSLANPGVNGNLKNFLPRLDIKSKTNIKNLCRNKGRLTSEYYESEVLLPWQDGYSYEMTFKQFINELAVRSSLDKDIPECFPLHTRGHWKSNLASSDEILRPMRHRIAKYKIDDVYDEIDSLIEKISLRDATMPKYIRKLTRLSEKLPDVFQRVLRDN
jgi:hypothetical protein